MREAGSPSQPERQPVPTSQGPAAVRVYPAVTAPAVTPPAGDPPAGEVSGQGAAPRTRGTLLVGHGAGGQRDAADVLALTDLARDGWTVVLVDQPWRVAGRKVATAPPTLDRAWSEVVDLLAQDEAAPDGAALPTPWVYAGRSAGARVACRTSVTGRAVHAVVALAFPLHPPGRPDRTRVGELALPLRAGIPTLVVQGGRDPMGTPEQIREALGEPLPESLTLCQVPGNHSPTRDLSAVQGLVRDFLGRYPLRDPLLAWTGPHP